VALPVPCWESKITRKECLLLAHGRRRARRPHRFPVLALRPSCHSHFSPYLVAWEGHWVYPPGEEPDAKICVKISATKTSPMRSSWVLPGRAYHIEVLDNSGVPPIVLQITRESQESALVRCTVFRNFELEFSDSREIDLALYFYNNAFKRDYDKFPESARECSGFRTIVTARMSFPSDLSEVAR
jgi:hypothetical protein